VQHRRQDKRGSTVHSYIYIKNITNGKNNSNANILPTINVVYLSSLARAVHARVYVCTCACMTQKVGT